MATMTGFNFLGSKITAGGDCSHKIKRHLILGRNPLHGNSPGKNTRLGLLCPPPGDLHNPGTGLRSPALQVDSLPSEPPWKPKNTWVGSLSLLQLISLTQELNHDLLNCRWILYSWAIREALWNDTLGNLEFSEQGSVLLRWYVNAKNSRIFLEDVFFY